MHLSNTLPHNNRIEIADVLRGFAVMGNYTYPFYRTV